MPPRAAPCRPMSSDRLKPRAEERTELAELAELAN